MSPEVINLILTGGGAAIIAAIINAFMNKKKLSAEATEIITKASAGVVENIMKDNEGLRRQMGVLESKVAELTVASQLAAQRERYHQLADERWRWHMERWHRWAARVLAEGKTVGLDLEPVPPMWPELPPAGEMRQ